MRKGQITLNFNSEFRQIILNNFGIVDEDDIKNLVLEFLKKGNEINLDEKIKKQKLLKLTLENWQLLKINGTIFEDAKQIVLLEKNVQEPEMEFKKHDRFCNFCKHTHLEELPHNCPNCNCGIRA